MESLGKLEDSRKCWRLVNGVLFEKTKAEVVPELESMIRNLMAVNKQLNEGLTQKKQEMMQMEQAYDSIMRQAKARKEEANEESNAKAGGVLV